MRTSFAIALLAASAAGALVPGGCTSRREAAALLGACAAQLTMLPASADEGE